MNAFYWIGDSSGSKRITVFRGEKRDLISGNEVVAEYVVADCF